MPEMRLEQAVGFRVWATMLADNRETYTFDAANAQLSFYGSDDSTYLVVNTFIGEKGIWEYVFLAEQSADRLHTAAMIFDFLKTVDFSLHNLLLWLEHAPFQDREMGEFVFTHGLAIKREYNECE